MSTPKPLTGLFVAVGAAGVLFLTVGAIDSQLSTPTEDEALVATTVEKPPVVETIEVTETVEVEAPVITETIEVEVPVIETPIHTETIRPPQTQTQWAPPPPQYTYTPPPATYVPEVFPQQDTNVYYKNCKSVWNDIGGPIYRGNPGYGSHLDRDGDGKGCENRPNY